ncbi:hypothetical protein ACOSP7_028720 [Xanthoceras sorbifolium]
MRMDTEVNKSNSESEEMDHEKQYDNSSGDLLKGTVEADNSKNSERMRVFDVGWFTKNKEANIVFENQT